MKLFCKIVKNINAVIPRWENEVKFEFIPELLNPKWAHLRKKSNCVLYFDYSWERDYPWNWIFPQWNETVKRKVDDKIKLGLAVITWKISLVESFKNFGDKNSNQNFTKVVLILHINWKTWQARQAPKN